MFRFANPSFLLLLVPLGIVAWRVFGRHRNRGVRFAPTHRLESRHHSWRAIAATVLPAVAVGGMVPVIIALARPQTILSSSKRTADVIAIQMVVDVSGSMEALDFSTKGPVGTKYRSRLDVVKSTFSDFASRRPADLIGLIIFGGYASTLTPLTSDHEALLHVLDGVATPKPAFDKNGNVLNQEELLTAIGDGLATACARLERTEPTSRIIVLLSDGESNTGIIEPKEATEAARKLGIKVYTIGIGSTGRAPFWGTDRFGRRAISYSQVALDEDLLRHIAHETDGRYFNVREPKGLEKALEEIDKLEKTRIDEITYHQYNELFAKFAVPGVLAIVLSATLNMVLSRRLF